MKTLVFTRIALFVLGLIVTWFVINRKQEPVAVAAKPVRKVTSITAADRDRLNLLANYARAHAAHRA